MENWRSSAKQPNAGEKRSQNWRTDKKNADPSNISRVNNSSQFRNGNQNNSTLYFNLTRLNELNEMDGNDVVTTLDRKKDEFEKLLHNVSEPDMLVATLRVLTNVCRANFNEIVACVLSHASSTNFIRSLEIYLTKLPFEGPIEKLKNKLYYKDKNNFWSNLIEFFQKVIELIPSKARDELIPLLQKINLISTSIEMSQNYSIDEIIKTAALNMLQELEYDLGKIVKTNEEQLNTNELDIKEDPPENFRTLSIIPTVDDLYNQKPFYRACKIKDAYDSVEHYLDVQFRLLREDFVSPLRNGIQEYLHGPQIYRNNELRIYRKVILLAPDVNKRNNVGIIAHFGAIKSIKWRHSKRFMHGGLLLLSRDNFKTVLFMTVVDRNEKDLENGNILLEPCEETIISRDMYNNINFIMLESKIYFEPYLAVLNAMQTMNEENFPMKSYLVNAETSTQIPQYLKEVQILEYKHFELPIWDDHSWPSAKELKLDESQYNAFKCALTQEFAIIQGPPGTGKTFIALEIIRTLLENKQHWKKYGPIVIVCLTNHALDQFLEGILQHTKSIVRVGSRSKSEALKQYTLMERRKSANVYNKSFATRDAVALMHNTKFELEKILNSIGKTRLFIECLTTADAIVPLSCLTEYCNDTILSEMKTNTDLLKWLIGINVRSLPKAADVEQQKNVEMIPEEIYEDEDIMDDELELNYDGKVYNSCIIFPLEIIDAKILDIQEKIQLYGSNATELAYNLPFDPTIEWEDYLNTLYTKRLSIQRKLIQHPILNQPRYPAHDTKWRLYWGWVKFSYDNALNKVTQLENTYRHIRSKLNEVKQVVDLATLKEHEIIGFTTSGAAKLQSSLRALHSPIVLVEEAAEILEAHVVCSLTKSSQHVILIGDHKQLRPKASVYELGIKYNLNISLFERMVNIRAECTQLTYQHRMRPQIARLITPSIYNILYNHKSVFEYPKVKGLKKNLFFINHKNRETSHNNEESWVNQHEAKFLITFARHLIMQGYKATEITILCTYTGQLFALMKETGRYTILKELRVTTVDNYQGEENKIILLSLVRNNGEGNIGFLKEENRVCVALSRAREGMYIMGNIDDLIIKNSIWPKIKKVLEDENAIGDTLVLQCQIHTDQLTKIEIESDFQKCPEGGCLKKCDADLSCGHACTSICHILDREHKQYHCKQSCFKSCPNDHPCPLMCWEGCKPCQVIVERKLKCGHTVKMPCSSNADTFPCYIVVEALLPHCNHNNKKLCHVSVEKCICSHPCENRLSCGHKCLLNCHVTRDPDHLQYQCNKDCTKNYINCENNHPCKKRCHEECGECPIIVAVKLRSCGHFYKQIRCSINIEDVMCKRPCMRDLLCGHKCPQKCSEECGNCQIMVKKKSSCGHTIEVKCCEEATPSKCGYKCQKTLPCCHPCTAKCKDKCITSCKIMIKLTEKGLCEHTFSVPCYMQNTVGSKSQEVLKYCKEPCKVQLACGHLCSGSCGDCKQGRIHIPCGQPCGNTLICGHKCDIPCRQECQPCKRNCELKCRHSKCNKKCGIPCVPCKEKCAWGCKHRKCTKRCFDLCDIEPCYEPCKKMLKCKHPCVGFCGDPCPPLCRICNNEELTEILFGDEDDPDARFVFLEDCSHCIESQALTKWVTDSSDQSIQLKTCPRCKTPIKKCMRIMNQIKKDLIDVLLVKEKVFFGKYKDLQKNQTEYLKICQQMMTKSQVIAFPRLKTLVQSLWDRGSIVRKQRKQILSAQEIEAFKIITDILGQMVNMLGLVKSHNTKSYEVVKNQIVMLADSFPNRWQISSQELKDIQLEVRRLNYMVEVCMLNPGYFSGMTQSTEEVVAVTKLMSIKRFTQEVEDDVKKSVNELCQYYKKNLVIEERKMIVKAMGFKQGHWYKCPNGHIYSIGDCGGAMVESNCNECGATIGGRSHRLRSDNRLASEMDGAIRPAYP